MDKAHIYGVISLLQQGEEELIAKVEAGRLPLDTAVVIARGKDADIQQALSEAYENGTLRGTKLREVQRLITRRKGETPPQESRKSSREAISSALTNITRNSSEHSCDAPPPSPTASRSSPRHYGDSKETTTSSHSCAQKDSTRLPNIWQQES